MPSSQKKSPPLEVSPPPAEVPTLEKSPHAKTAPFTKATRSRLRQEARALSQEMEGTMYGNRAKLIYDIVQTIPLSETRPKPGADSALRAIRAIIKTWEKNRGVESE